jgi:hypothetical protein
MRGGHERRLRRCAGLYLTAHASTTAAASGADGPEKPAAPQARGLPLSFRPMTLRWCLAPVAALAALVLVACGSSGPAPLSASCKAAVTVARYIQGRGAPNDLEGDQDAAYSLHTAKWATAGQRRYAAALSRLLDTVGTDGAGNAVQLIPAAKGLLKACGASGS